MQIDKTNRDIELSLFFQYLATIGLNLIWIQSFKLSKVLYFKSNPRKKSSRRLEITTSAISNLFYILKIKKGYLHSGSLRAFVLQKIHPRIKQPFN